jgi:D-alanyl-D-alanine carboxypeptidase/D-alanyl-D-alanine-endopeptidase (penicillin-binding protein 4)
MSRRTLATAAVAALAFTVPVASASASPYRSALDRAAAPAGGHVSVVVADARTGHELYSRRPGKQRVLASNTKLFVTGAAADRWGSAIAPTLAAILRPSDNALAERLATRLGHGSERAGVRVAVRFARSLAVRVRLHDGAGLDPANRASARQMVAFLLAMRHVPGFDAWKRALPIAARTGTLAYRMRGTAAAGRCHAKTGTLFLRTLASTLSGYCTTRSGRTVAFSVLIGGIGIDAARVIADRLVARIAAVVWCPRSTCHRSPERPPRHLGPESTVRR